MFTSDMLGSCLRFCLRGLLCVCGARPAWKMVLGRGVCLKPSWLAPEVLSCKQTYINTIKILCLPSRALINDSLYACGHTSLSESQVVSSSSDFFLLLFLLPPEPWLPSENSNSRGATEGLTDASESNSVFKKRSCAEFARNSFLAL